MAVNKVVYGDETLVDLTNDSVTPDTLAEGATAHDASGARITGTMKSGGGTSVQSDWNQTDETAADFIKNKPFGDMPTGGDTLYWDGNTEGLVCVADMAYKVSDAVPTADDVANGCVVTAAAGVVELHFSDTGNGILVEDNGFAIIVSDSGIGIDMGGFAFPEAGTYLNGTLNVRSLTIPCYTGFPATKKMEEKYLPSAVILYADADEGLYLCSDSEGTERIAKAQLKSFFESGMAIYFSDPIFTEGMYVPLSILINDGYTFGAAFLQYMEANEFFYTAEYVPEG